LNPEFHAGIGTETVRREFARVSTVFAIFDYLLTALTTHVYGQDTMVICVPQHTNTYSDEDPYPHSPRVVFTQRAGEGDEGSVGHHSGI